MAKRSSAKSSSALSWLGLALIILIIDQITKLIAKHYLFEAIPRPVFSFLNWTLVYNPGAAFSFLSQAGGWQRWFFTGLGVVAAIFIIYLLFKNHQQKIFSTALSLILAGAIGNVIDRIAYGAVVDFIDLHHAGWHWPAFNIADSAISVGVVLLLIDEIRRVNRS